MTVDVRILFISDPKQIDRLFKAVFYAYLINLFLTVLLRI